MAIPSFLPSQLALISPDRHPSKLLEPTGKGKGGGEGFAVTKSGDARVAMIG